MKYGSASAGDSSGTTLSSDYLDDTLTNTIGITQSFVNVVEGKSFKARLGGDCGTQDDWYIVCTVPSYADSGKVFMVHNVAVFAQEGAAQLKVRVGVSDDYDTSYGDAITAIPYNGVLGISSDLVGYEYIGTDATGLPSDLGTATFYGEIGNFGLCENNIDGISKENPLIVNNGDTFIIQVSNEYFQDQRVTIEFDWWEMDGDYFSSDFTDNLS